MIKFGTGGWRALIGENFTKENVKILSQAVAGLIKLEGGSRKGFVIGYDRRFLSDKAAVWFAEVLAANGIEVYFINKVAPTPLIMYAVKTLGANMGAAVTASHNPADYNGIKIFTYGGRDASEVVTDAIEEQILKVQSVETVDFQEAVKDGIIQYHDPFNEYIDEIIGLLDMDAIRNCNLKIALDPMYGVSKTCLQTILLTARCELEIIHDRHDTLFGGRLPSPSTHTLQRLKELVVEKGLDIGIGTDGDADRLGIIDEKGEFIHPNNILSLLYYYLLKYKGWKGGVVRNLATTHLLDRIASAFGEKCHEVPVGFKHISSKMSETNSIIGGESSGGLTIRGHINGKDGIFAASLLVELICKSGKKLSELLDEINRQFGYFVMVENDLAFKASDRERLEERLFVRKEIPDLGYEIREAGYMDGLKVYFVNGGWVTVRFSGTEPLLRIFAEMEDEASAVYVCNKMRDFLKI